MSRLGTVTLQSMDECDVFIKKDVYIDGIPDWQEMQITIQEPGFDEQLAWVSGQVPTVTQVLVSGDTSVIYGWFKGESLMGPFRLRIYVEYEEEDENDRATDTTENS